MHCNRLKWNIFAVDRNAFVTILELQVARSRLPWPEPRWTLDGSLLILAAVLVKTKNKKKPSEKINRNNWSLSVSTVSHSPVLLCHCITRTNAVWMTLSHHTDLAIIRLILNTFIPRSPTHQIFRAYYDITSLQLTPEASHHDIIVCTRAEVVSLPAMTQ